MNKPDVWIDLKLEKPKVGQLCIVRSKIRGHFVLHILKYSGYLVNPDDSNDIYLTWINDMSLQEFRPYADAWMPAPKP